MNKISVTFPADFFDRAEEKIPLSSGKTLVVEGYKGIIENESWKKAFAELYDEYEKNPPRKRGGKLKQPK